MRPRRVAAAAFSGPGAPLGYPEPPLGWRRPRATRWAVHDEESRDDAEPQGTGEPGAAPAQRRTERRSERRRRARDRGAEAQVPSPCIAVCQLETGTDLCVGCLRHMDEIRDWPVLSAEEKQAVLHRVAERRAARS